MSVVNIFLTNPTAAAMEDFTHGQDRFVFGRLTAEGPERLIEGPVWFFVDWVMDSLAGIEMCRRLRADPRTAAAHITIVLEADDADDRRRALRAGADDYAVGPLDRRAILDRVLAVDPHARRRFSPGRMELGALTIDLDALMARWNGKPVVLPPNEFRLLRLMAENADHVLSREDVIVGLGKHGHPLDARTVDVWIGRLRRALKAAGAGNPLRTVRSFGYVFDTPN
ncbi:winged helix-turn-helix transcriptional regulator [Tsuneonella sp. HG249]